VSLASSVVSQRQLNQSGSHRPILRKILYVIIDEGLAVEGEHNCATDIGIVERCSRAVDQKVEVEIHRRRLADRLRRVLPHQLAVVGRHFPGEGEIEAVGDEAQDRRRWVADDVEVVAVEVGLVLLPVVRVAHQPDVLELAELGELERPVPIGRERICAGDTWQG